MSKNKFFGSMSGKGYYIALILCAAAIGISGYLYYRNANQEESMSKDPSSYQNPQEGTVPAVATRPGTDATEPSTTNPTKPTEKPEPLKTGAPVSGETITDYAMDCLVYNDTTRDWRVHNGVDIAAEEGTPVLAAAAGSVYTVYEDETMGMTVVIRHQDGYTTKYASLDKEVKVQPGDEVELGQEIGCVGKSAMLESSLGHHVHFSVSLDGASIDPQEFLDLGK